MRRRVFKRIAVTWAVWAVTPVLWALFPMFMLAVYIMNKNLMDRVHGPHQ